MAASGCAEGTKGYIIRWVRSKEDVNGIELTKIDASTTLTPVTFFTSNSGETTPEVSFEALILAVETGCQTCILSSAFHRNCRSE